MSIVNRLPPFGLVREFLGAGTVEQLLAYAQLSQHLFHDSTVGYGEGREVDKQQRCSRALRESVLRENGDFAGRLEASMKQLMPTMIETLGNTTFNPHKFEIEMVAHGDGAFFAKHVDLATGRHLESDRVISCVYYFHATPKAFSGGVLRLHSLAASGQPGTFVDIEPFFDTLVYFPSWFPHEVLPISCPSGRFIDSRFAINCWVHRAGQSPAAV
jgi:Rps23 Pro-64 3,4-dihydroxylase Tpa1-like proline 4-hydroxylase